MAKSAKKKTAKKRAKSGRGKRATGTVSEVLSSLPAGAPTEVDGKRVIGETGDGAAWVCDDGNGGSIHVVK